MNSKYPSFIPKYPRSTIPNEAGMKLIVHLETGESIEAEIFRDETGCHCLHLPIEQVKSWSHIEPENWIAPQR
jgi:hypothetical protein